MIQRLIQTITRRIPQEHIAIGHDWLLGIRGGEKVLQAIAECFPASPIYTLFHDKAVSQSLGIKNPITTSILNRLPFVKYYYRYLFFLYAVVIRRLSPSKAKLVLTTSHTLIKNIRSQTNNFSIAYIFAPLRYVYARKQEYIRASWVYRWVGPVFSIAFDWIKRWDKRRHQSIHASLTLSQYIARQIENIYGQHATVIYPFYDQDRFVLSKNPVSIPQRKYFLLLGALVPYKRPEIVCEAFAQLPYDLKVVGTGPMLRRLQKQYAGHANITFEGFVADEKLPELYQNARGLIFPGIEDFGIVPLEAAACGCPVIAYPEGGIMETLGKHVFPIKEQTPQGILQAIYTYAKARPDIETLSRCVQGFTKENFQRQYLEQIIAVLGLEHEKPKFTAKAVIPDL